MTNPKPITNLAFYKFVTVLHPQQLADTVLAFCEPLELGGSIIIAEEGLNGMVAGPPDVTQAFIEAITALPDFEDLQFKRSYCNGEPFRRMRVRVKPEIVTLRQEGVDAVESTARHLAPEQLRDWLRAGESITLIDTRNDYEVKMGTFKGALDPNTEVFSEFPEYVQKHAAELKDEKVIMFCTGGIRCEKVTGWVIDQGYNDVYQLEGGILNYFDKIEDAQKDWDGELFVFDRRVGVDTNLEETDATLCRACGDPIPNVDAICECGGRAFGVTEP